MNIWWVFGTRPSCLTLQSSVLTSFLDIKGILIKYMPIPIGDKKKSWWFIENFRSVLTHNLNKRSKSLKLLQNGPLWHKPAMPYGWSPGNPFVSCRAKQTLRKPAIVYSDIIVNTLESLASGPWVKLLFKLCSLQSRSTSIASRSISSPQVHMFSSHRHQQEGLLGPCSRMRVTSLSPLLPED